MLVFTEPRGSGGFVGYGRTKKFGQNPAAFLYKKGNNLTIFAAMNMEVPTVTDLDRDPTEVIETGDCIRVDGDRGIVEVTKRKHDQNDENPFQDRPQRFVLVTGTRGASHHIS